MKTRGKRVQETTHKRYDICINSITSTLDISHPSTKVKQKAMDQTNLYKRKRYNWHNNTNSNNSTETESSHDIQDDERHKNIGNIRNRFLNAVNNILRLSMINNNNNNNTMIVMCYSSLAKIIVILCLIWALCFPLMGGSSYGKSLYSDWAKHSFLHDKKAGVPILMLTIPILIAGSVATLFATATTNNNNANGRSNRFRKTSK